MTFAPMSRGTTMTGKNKKDPDGGGKPSGPRSLGEVEVVRDENSLERWTNQVLQDTDLDYKTRFILRAFVLQLDRTDWSVRLIPKRLQEEIGMPESTFYEYVQKAKDSRYVEQDGEHEYQGPDRTLWRPRLLLVLPN